MHPGNGGFAGALSAPGVGGGSWMAGCGDLTVKIRHGHAKAVWPVALLYKGVADNLLASTTPSPQQRGL